VAARRRRYSRGMAEDVGPQIAAVQARAAIVIVTAEEQREDAVVAGTGLESPEQCRADAAALTAGRHHQRVDLPTVRVAPQRTDPADQPLALQRRVAQPVRLVASPLDLGFRLARLLVARGQAGQRFAQDEGGFDPLRGGEGCEVDEGQFRDPASVTVAAPAPIRRLPPTLLMIPIAFGLVTKPPAREATRA
jgi:hypothetical protein